tara:strand:+ start:963 stop:1271 length:309 start_codon:yes stop_codon:yes gene_type:complete
MATITKKAAKRISELLSDARLYESLSERSSGDGTGSYYRHAYNEGVAVRALFDEFGIEGAGLDYFTEDKVESFRIAADEVFAERRAARQAKLEEEREAEMRV